MLLFILWTTNIFINSNQCYHSNYEPPMYLIPLERVIMAIIHVINHIMDHPYIPSLYIISCYDSWYYSYHRSLDHVFLSIISCYYSLYGLLMYYLQIIHVIIHFMDPSCIPQHYHIMSIRLSSINMTLHINTK